MEKEPRWEEGRIDSGGSIAVRFLSMVHCSACGGEVEINAKVCSLCGRPITALAIPDPPSSIWPWIVGGVLLVLVIGIRISIDTQNVEIGKQRSQAKAEIAKDENNPLLFQRYCGQSPIVKRTGRRDLLLTYPQQGIVILYKGDPKADTYGIFTDVTYGTIDKHILTLDQVTALLDCRKR